MNSFTTIYLTEDYQPDASEISHLEYAVEREIAVSEGFINVYSRDKELIKDLVDIIGEFYVKEIAWG